MSKKITQNDGFASAACAKDAADTVRKKLNTLQQSLTAIRATAHATDRVQGYGLKKLNDNELKSIFALVSWVANQQSAAEETVQSMTEARFKVENVADIKCRDYDEVIKFLVDLRIDEMRH